MAVEMSREEFEDCVAQALDEIPEELAALISNCVVLVEDSAPDDEPDLLGLYDGIPLTERGLDYSGVLPDRVFVYRENLLAMCADRDELTDEIHVTVVHEIAHHFGIDDDRLHQLGYA